MPLDLSSFDLSIDTDLATERICAWLCAQRAAASAHGLLLGLSGGLDSCVLAALAVRAVGVDAVHVVYLHDRDSDAAIAGNARLMAEALGLRLEVQAITGEMDRRGVYRPLFIRATRLSPIVARLSAVGYRVLCGETPFKSTLRVGGGARLRPWYKRALFNATIAHIDAGFSARHIHRRALLEARAAADGLLLVGAANRSETEAGWFVKDGIDDLPVQPLTGLLKTQVRQLAAALDLPLRVRSQLPSPDMVPGVTDEFGIGHDYALLDQVIEAQDRGLGDDAISALGIPQSALADIRDLRRLSEWKRASPHAPPPVSGAFGADIRR